MRNLTLDDLRLGLKDLLEDHDEDLDRSLTGKLYRPLIAQKRAELEGLSETTERSLPFAAELAETDAAHDAMGASIHHLTQAIILNPAIDDDTKDVASRTQQAFVPTLGVLQARYADQAAHTHRKRPIFNELRPDLERIQVPGGSNLAEWVVTFLDQGDRIGRLLDRRAEAGVGVGVEASATGGALRSSVIGLLGRFRQGIRDEVASGATLPSDYEARIFAFIDQLDRTRAEANKRRARTKGQEGPSQQPPKSDGDDPPPCP